MKLNILAHLQGCPLGRAMREWDEASDAPL